ncbi:hypothetical protein BOTBODRAFT_103467 [Botryobasidium botryosum FD-172 SS1]|uniref:Protein kinase domain-containing protein n=1 Tax=Botryobasidium botryosum (strain FD-172 SS1) TaxID=930990 RepID=A0A067N4S8_BOTB1|nr:hypothetical protein BOTBODRAFT_103467 [Botryobasidium botryosum FD-172 SS1]
MYGGRQFVGTAQLQEYEMLDKLGEGTFGEVHKALHVASGKMVALKRILMHNEKEGFPITALREIKILKKLQHPNVVTLTAMIVSRSAATLKSSIYMVFPYMDHDLSGLLENKSNHLAPSQIKLYMKQLCEGVSYLHRNKILHRDLKSANLLISNEGVLQIADFGLARPVSQINVTPRAVGTEWKGGRRDAEYTNCVVTRWYRAPELLLGETRYGGAIDLWSVGCIFGEMFVRKPIFMGTSDVDQLEKIFDTCGSPNNENFPGWNQLPGSEGIKEWKRKERKVKLFTEHLQLPADTADFLDKLLTLDPCRRMTALEALDHDYFWTDPMPADPKTWGFLVFPSPSFRRYPVFYPLPPRNLTYTFCLSPLNYANLYLSSSANRLFDYQGSGNTLHRTSTTTGGNQLQVPRPVLKTRCLPSRMGPGRCALRLVLGDLGHPLCRRMLDNLTQATRP